MAKDVPSFGSQSKCTKIATHLFAQNFYIRTCMGTKLDTIYTLLKFYIYSDIESR